MKVFKSLESPVKSGLILKVNSITDIERNSKREMKLTSLH